MAALIATAPVHTRADHRQRHIPRLGALLFAVLLVVMSALFGCGGGVSTADVQPTNVPTTDVPSTDVPPTDVPPADVPPADVPPGVPAGTGTATLTWSAPTTNVDGTPLTTLAGYKVFYGTTPGVYTSLVVGNVNSYQVVGLTTGQTYYFTVTAYDSSGNESDYAPIVSKPIS